VEDNFNIIKELASLSVLDLPILIGVSRKSSIYKTLGIEASQALNGTTVVNTIGLINGAHILRVHDVKEAQQIIQLLPYLQ
jgi:dihydropteroate synthase